MESGNCSLTACRWLTSPCISSHLLAILIKSSPARVSDTLRLPLFRSMSFTPTSCSSLCNLLVTVDCVRCISSAHCPSVFAETIRRKVLTSSISIAPPSAGNEFFLHKKFLMGILYIKNIHYIFCQKEAIKIYRKGLLARCSHGLLIYIYIPDLLRQRMYFVD
ncbi:hypothetical protein SDC9_178016 [bioreactor metagenome]|uniref:Uncharacterized protein n=1 Tax=bioreactor metagenome TaxID=1076179 RepID=A0A645GUU1_9ZZZZ